MKVVELTIRGVPEEAVRQFRNGAAGRDVAQGEWFRRYAALLNVMRHRAQTDPQVAADLVQLGLEVKVV